MGQPALTPRRRRPQWLPHPGLALAGVAYAAVAARLDPFSWPIRAAVILPFCAVVVLALRRGWHRRWEEPAEPAAIRWGTGLAVWAVLIGAAVAFQLGVYTSSPRNVYPTLSSLSAIAFDWPGVRAAAFAVWLWIGWYVVER